MFRLCLGQAFAHQETGGGAELAAVETAVMMGVDWARLLFTSEGLWGDAELVPQARQTLK